MGIKGLTALITEHAPKAITEHDIKTLFGRKVAIDASMSIYQFLIAVRQKDGEMLMNEAGETTSHLMGLFYRTLRIIDNGIKPVYVFDGKPPELKAGVLSKRFDRRQEAAEGIEEAKEVGTTEELDRFSRRTVKVTKEHNEECRRLLQLMGVPYVLAPSEAEAQCAALARAGLVYAAGSEDMDTLTFSAPILLRHLTFSEARKQPISEINLAKALEGLEMEMSQGDIYPLLVCSCLQAPFRQFIDLCILLGCDYLEPIKGVGPKSALKLIREYGDLASIIEHLREKSAAKASKAAKAESSEEEAEVPSGAEEGSSKVKKRKPKGSGGTHVPEEWPWEEAKKVFEEPEVIPPDQIQLEWRAPDVDGLVQFLVTEKGFNEDRVRKGAEKLSKSITTKQQGRLDGFFTVKPKESGSSPKGKGKGKAKDDAKRGTKRARPEDKKAGPSKKVKK